MQPANFRSIQVDDSGNEDGVEVKAAVEEGKGARNLGFKSHRANYQRNEDDH
jgi:hypothetical protein